MHQAGIIEDGNIQENVSATNPIRISLNNSLISLPYIALKMDLSSINTVLKIRAIRTK